MPSANDTLRDLANQQAFYLRGFSNATAIEAAALIAATEKDLIEQIIAQDKKLNRSPLTRKRMDDLLADVARINDEAYASYLKFLQSKGTELSLFAAESMAEAMNKATRQRLRDVTFTKRIRSDKLVWVDTATFEEAWKLNKQYYELEPDKVARFAEFMKTAPSIQVSEVVVNEDGSVGFHNGRHRYAFMRDGGMKAIPVAMDKDSVVNATTAGYIVADPSAPVVAVALSANLPSPKVIAAAIDARPFEGALLKEWVADMSAARIDRIEKAIRIGVLEGETIDNIVRRIKGTAANGYKDGVLDISRRSAEAMAITYMNNVHSVARQTLFEENDDIIKGVEWVSTLDGRTSSVCQARDGEVYPVKSGPRPPAHIRCRSTTTPVTKSWRELGIDMDDMDEGTRASMDGQVSSKETYQTWLSKKPAEFQDKVLGKDRAEAFRNGGVTLDKFIDLNGHRLTLEQLKAKRLIV